MLAAALGVKVAHTIMVIRAGIAFVTFAFQKVLA
jgi:hypothetical protein